FYLSCDLVGPRQKSDMMRQICLRPCRLISDQTAAQERNSPFRITMFSFEPPPTDRSVSAPEGEILLGCNRNHLIQPLADDRVASGKQKQHRATSQRPSRRGRMGQSLSLCHSCTALC